MKRLKHLFDAAAATQPQTAEVSEPTAVEKRPTTVTLTAKAKPKLSVLQPASEEVLRKNKRLGIVPAMSCDVCAIAEDCPEFTPGDACHFDEAWSSFDSRDLGDLIAMKHDVVKSNFKRYQRAKLMEERVHGGMIDPNVSRLGKDVMEGAMHLINLENSHREITMTQEMSQDDEVDPILAAFMGAPAETAIELNPEPPALPQPNPVYQPPVEVLYEAPGQRTTKE